MDKNNKWLMFKNYMHNELGITKEDIRQWIQETIQIEAKKICDKTFNSFDLDKFIKNRFLIEHNLLGSPTFKKQVLESISKEVAKLIEIKVISRKELL